MPTPAGPNKNSLGDRRLAAIVFTDVAGFSSLMETNEHHTLLLIRRDLKLISEVCKGFGGDVLKNTGDGCLATFLSVESAVSSALKIQRIVADASRRLPPEEILHHRIGIHLGDVFINQGDVLGNGVNIAARLLGEAEPDGICISQTVYDLVKHRLDVRAICIGARELKNIREAMQVYRLVLNAAAEEQKDLAADRAGHRRLITASVIFALLAIGIAAWFILRAAKSPVAGPVVAAFVAPTPSTAPTVSNVPITSIAAATRPVVEIVSTTAPATTLPTALQVPGRKADYTVDSSASWQGFRIVSTELLKTSIEDNAYVMAVQAGTLRFCISAAPWNSFDDVTIEARARIHGPPAASWGLELFSARGPRKLVRVTIASNGLVRIDLSRLTGTTENNLPLNPDAVYLFRDQVVRHVDNPNTVILDVRDHKLSLAVNGQQVGDIYDITPLGSATVILTADGVKGAVATFEQLHVWFPHSRGG